MAFHLHIMGASGRLASLAEQMEGCVSGAEAAIAAHIVVPPIDVIVADRPDHTIPEDGIGGFSGQADLISMALDPGFDGLDFAPKGAFVRALVHETHHALRWAGVGYGRTLGGALVSEGLAGHFVHEVLGTSPEPWERAVEGAALATLIDEAAAQWDDGSYDHAAWFFGASDQPHWGGYTVGFHLVGRYLADNPDQRPSGLAGLDSATCRPV